MNLWWTNSPKHWVGYFTIHNHCFKHRPFSDNELHNAIDKWQYRPTKKENSKLVWIAYFHMKNSKISIELLLFIKLSAATKHEIKHYKRIWKTMKNKTNLPPFLLLWLLNIGVIYISTYSTSLNHIFILKML